MSTTSRAAGVENPMDHDGGTGAGAPDPALASLVRFVPLALPVVSALFGAAATGPVVGPTAFAWSLAPTAALFAARLAELRYGDRIVTGGNAAVAAVAANLAVVLVASLLNPFVCIAAFAGYLDADRYLRGRQVMVAGVATGLVTAVGQGGGIPGSSHVPWLYPALAAVNVGIGMVMLHFAREREQQVAARERVALELAAVHEENLALHHRLLEQARETGVGEERARLSREIHDTVAQGLIGVISQLEAIGAVDPPVRERVERAETAARDCLVEARRAVRALAPRQLSGHTLTEALHDLTRNWARTHQIVAELDVDGAPDSARHGDVLLRVAQESLANAARHSGASTVRLVLGAREGRVELAVADDGAGFDPAAAAARGEGRGLAGMGDRVTAVGGAFEVESRVGQGCRVVAAVPV
ncbi:sensor histidine kinase [Nocardiopsis sp. CC223A]|uniref:sensor histidine kinase n=1 Tax=Nocardiopsis sp. CC223A TaxID=3044051 RepID=UPI00278C6D49|nr:sensor histidine kinase [Nocardiopsis sp. CC223A]